MPHSGSQQSVFQLYQEILATPSGNNAKEKQQEAWCGLDSCYAQLYLDPVDSVRGYWHSPAAPLLTKQSLLGSKSSSGPFPARLLHDIRASDTKPLGQLVTLFHQSSSKGSLWGLSSLRQVANISQIGDSWWNMFHVICLSLTDKYLAMRSSSEIDCVYLRKNEHH